jgi:multicomponent Na+:H+ antiporter subunit B
MDKPEKQPGMNLITQMVTRWLAGPIVLYGIHIVFTGNFSPGGGFDAGVVIACAFVLITLAFGVDFTLRRVERITALKLASLGAVLFIVIALLGYAGGGAFFGNFNHPHSTIIFSNIAICLVVWASLFMFFLILAVIRVVDSKTGGKKMVQRRRRK